MRKVRFTVRYDGMRRSLFSIMERRSGDLTIGIRTARNMATTSHFDSQAILTEHISVHRSPASPGFTITNTIVPEGGPAIKTATFVSLYEGTGFVPAYAVVCTDFSARLRPQIARREELNELIPFGTEDKKTLIYVMIISNLLEMLPDVPGFCKIIVKFDYFQFGLYYCFGQTAPSPFGFRCTFGTSAARIDGEPTSTFRIEGGVALREFAALEGFLKALVPDLMMKTFHSIGIIFPKENGGFGPPPIFYHTDPKKHLEKTSRPPSETKDHTK